MTHWKPGLLYSKFYILNSRYAFTFAELLVAMGLFSVAVSIAVGGFVQALRTQRRVIALIAANSNASLAIEQIAREIRTGTNFECVGGIVTCSELRFRNAEGDTAIYRLFEGALERGSGGNFEQVTASNVNIRSLSFELLSNPSYPPRVTIALGVSVRAPGEPGVTNLQTTVSARQF